MCVCVNGSMCARHHFLSSVAGKKEKNNHSAPAIRCKQIKSINALLQMGAWLFVYYPSQPPQKHNRAKSGQGLSPKWRMSWNDSMYKSFFSTGQPPQFKQRNTPPFPIPQKATLKPGHDHLSPHRKGSSTTPQAWHDTSPKYSRLNISRWRSNDGAQFVLQRSQHLRILHQLCSDLGRLRSLVPSSLTCCGSRKNVF